MKICFVGNYDPDRQESMNRFTEWLRQAVTKKSEQAEVLHPKAVMINLVGRNSPLAKWLGYIDKFILFPAYLRIHARLSRNKHVIYHVVDHSNAVYANCLPANRTLLTCHDVLAIRDGFGDPNAWCKSTPTGKLLQRWILKHLQKCPHIVFVSSATHDDYLRLPFLGKNRKKPQLRNVIHNGLNNGFTNVPREEALEILERNNIHLTTPFIFHIGSSLPRKNRIGILKAFEQFQTTHSSYQMVFAGASFSLQEQQTFKESGFKETQFLNVGRVSHDVLNALYSLAFAFVFPSFSEGFGWPIIEAQASGCPVIYANRTSLPEVAGDSGISCDPVSPKSICEALLQLIEPGVRDQMILSGCENIKRFNSQNTSDRYLEMYHNKSSQTHELH